MTNTRQESAHLWLTEVLHKNPVEIKPLTGDASFRRYFRVIAGKTTYILMDAPPEKENCAGFIKITDQLKTGHIRAPDIYAANLDMGFLLLEDFGDTLLLNKLNDSTADKLYRQTIDMLIEIQQIDCTDLPCFDKQMLTEEMQLFVIWYCQQHLEIKFNTKQQKIFADAFEKLAENALSQPQVFVHRDYHSRNLMLLNNREIGVIDYQDAVRGPLSYDLISLLKDCYIRWPDTWIDRWLNYFLTHSPREQHPQYNKEQFKYWCELMGVQRHLKASGIFARLYHRDNKSNYLNDIPQTLAYIKDSLSSYPEFSEFHHLLTQLPTPR